MSFIVLLDGNEMKWKIEKKIKRSGEPEIKDILPRKKVAGNKNNFLVITSANGTMLAFVTNYFLPLYRQMTELLQRTDRHASDN